MNTKYIKGFTLIEVLIYLALLSMLIVGMMRTAYALSNGRDSAHTTLAFEGEFLMDKLQWVLLNAQDVSLPAAGQSGSQLALTRVVGIGPDASAITEQIEASLDPRDAQKLSMTIGNNTPEDLNSSMHVAALNFYHATSSLLGAPGETVGIYLKLSMLASDGTPVSETFMSTTSLQ